MRSCTISEKLYPSWQVSCQWVCIFNLLMKFPWEKREHKWWRHKLMSFLYCSANNAIARTYCMHKFAGIYYSHFAPEGRSPTWIWVFKTSCLLVCNNSLDSWPLIANNWMLSQEKSLLNLEISWPSTELYQCQCFHSLSFSMNGNETWPMGAGFKLQTFIPWQEVPPIEPTSIF